jgi:hypothetical protein
MVKLALHSGSFMQSSVATDELQFAAFLVNSLPAWPPLLLALQKGTPPRHQDYCTF